MERYRQQVKAYDEKAWTPRKPGQKVPVRPTPLNAPSPDGAATPVASAAPGLAAIQDKARSTIPTLGYGVSYAVGNVLLALWGTVVVLLMTG